MTYYLIYMVIGITTAISDRSNIRRIASDDERRELGQAVYLMAASIMVVGCVLTWPVWFAYRVKFLFQGLTKKEKK